MLFVKANHIDSITDTKECIIFPDAVFNAVWEPEWLESESGSRIITAIDKCAVTA